MESQRPSGKAFAALLLAQVGAHAANQFAERLAPLKLSPAHAGILRRLAVSPGISQRELAEQLGMHASRLVGVVDGMESLGLVKRKGNPEDRRSYSLEITPAGRERMGEVGKVAYEHNEAMCAGLSIDERVALVSLLQRIADRQGLLGGVHPGFRDLGGNRERVVASRATRATATAIPE